MILFNIGLHLNRVYINCQIKLNIRHVSAGDKTQLLKNSAVKESKSLNTFLEHLHIRRLGLPEYRISLEFT